MLQPSLARRRKFLLLVSSEGCPIECSRRALSKAFPCRGSNVGQAEPCACIQRCVAASIYACELPLSRRSNRCKGFTKRSSHGCFKPHPSEIGGQRDANGRLPRLRIAPVQHPADKVSLLEGFVPDRTCLQVRVSVWCDVSAPALHLACEIDLTSH